LKSESWDVKSTAIQYEKVAEVFGKTAQLQVLIYLLNCPEEGDYQSGIAKAINLSHSSVSRVVEPLMKKGIFIEKRIGKLVRVFQINHDSEVAQKTRKYFESVFSENDL
jgi:predicted transcriptional regulator